MPVGLTTLSNRFAPSVSPGLLVLEEEVQRSTGVRHLLHRLAGDDICPGNRPEERAIDSPACMGAPSVRRAGHKSFAHVAPPNAAIGVAGHAKPVPDRAIARVGSEHVQRATGLGA